jgi:hypothetical protein
MSFEDDQGHVTEERREGGANVDKQEFHKSPFSSLSGRRSLMTATAPGSPLAGYCPEGFGGVVRAHLGVLKLRAGVGPVSP